ncbi:AtpZ/AtpI family protein [Flavisolibacter nicotianae]|uniref:AtpZ/AtpI family protein n=1 Tax=Flavisolibacter nicotianae TaxID=2364882 RepID=UPI000EAD9DB0|nr:AtpZ/AtpI family protein [Flavisolibacter nicotianae]
MPKQTNASNDLMRYAGLGAQILVSIGIAVFIGLKLDQWLHVPFPLLVWLLPLVVVSMTIYKLIKETSKKK